MKDWDSFIPDLESLFRSLEEDTVIVNGENVLSIDSDVTKLNNGLSADSDMKKLNSALSVGDDLKKLNSGLTVDSFVPQAEGTVGNDVISEVQLKELFADIGEDKDNLVMTESCQSGSTDICTKWSEASSYLEDTVDRHITNGNYSQELALTLLCGESEHSGSTAAGHPTLNRSTSPATRTMQDLNISQHSVASETVVTDDSVVHAGQGTVSGEIPSQPFTKRKVRADETSNLKTAILTSQEESCGQLSHTEILHSMTNDNRTETENRTALMTSEVCTPGVTPYTVREVQDHSYSKVKDEHFISTSQEESFKLPSHDETSHSFSTVDDTVSGRSMGDIAVEVSIPGLTASAVREGLAPSAFSMKDQNVTDQLNVGTDCPVITEHSFPVTAGIHDVSQLLSETDIGDLTVDILNLALNDIPVGQNVTVMSCDMESMVSGTETKEASFKALETSHPYMTENMLRVKNDNTSTSQLHSINEGIQGTDQAVMLGMLIKKNKLSAEENTCTVTNCIPNVPVNINSSNVHLMHCTKTTDSDVNPLQKPTHTTKGRQTAIARRNSVGMDCPQLSAVGSDVEQVETRSRTDLQKNELCSWSRARKKMKNDLKIDDLKYSSVTNGKNQVDVTNSERLSGPEITIASAANSKKPLSSVSLAAATQKRSKDDITISQADQNKSTEIPALPPGSYSQQNSSKLCDTQKNKLIRKETVIDKTSSSLKSHISFAHIKREKFAGFTFEKPLMPQENRGRYSKKDNRSKTKGFSKGMKKHRRNNKALPSLTNHAYPDPSTPNTSNTDSSNKLSMLEAQCSIEGNQVENTNELHCTNTESDIEISRWIQELLM
ncbi:hypothetical protein B7P43_G13592 [Cryptotermes secundus]|nr:uncharacterized protein LOC111865828 isoform X2 [Cryptotermes secundus]PNF31264.1 hypothetical protein B7P43_G13592 [Cryptotermes secundus]